MHTPQLYNPQQGTDALIDEFGEHPQGIRSSQRLGWSQDSRWLYITDIWRYVGDRFMGPDNHIIDTDYFIFRIDLEHESASLIASQRAAFLQTVDIGDEWIIYSQGTLEGRSIWKIRVDGSDLALVKYTQSFSPNYSVFWATPDDAVILIEEHTVNGLTRVVFRRVESRFEDDRLLTFGGVSTFQSIRHFVWSKDRSHLAFVAETLQHEQSLVIMTSDGVVHYVEKVEFCGEIPPIWHQNNLITVERDGNKCRLKQTSLRDLSFSIIDTFPNDFTVITVIDATEPAWLKVDNSHTSTLIALDGSKTIDVEPITDGTVVTWSWLPLQSHSFIWAVGVGILTFAVGCLNFVWSSSISKI